MVNEDILKLCVNVNNVEFFSSEQNRSFIATIDVKKKGKYDVNHGNVAFITEDAGYYVSPFAYEIIPLLESQGFTKSDLIVPFGLGYFPMDLGIAAKWHLLVSERDKTMSGKNLESTNEVEKHR